jgi:hypothetical protein
VTVRIGEHRTTPRSPLTGRCGAQTYVYTDPASRRLFLTCSADVDGHDPEFHTARFGGHADGVEFHFTIRFRYDEPPCEPRGSRRADGTRREGGGT